MSRHTLPAALLALFVSVGAAAPLAADSPDADTSDTPSSDFPAVASTKLADAPRLALIREGTPLYAEPSAETDSWTAPDDIVVPVEELEKGKQVEQAKQAEESEYSDKNWLRARPAADLPAKTDTCQSRISEDYDVEFFVPRDEIATVVTRATTLQFDDGSAVSVAPGTPVHPGENNTVQIDLEDIGVNATLPADRLAKTFSPQSIEMPEPPEEPEHELLNFELSVNAQSVTDAPPKKDEKERDADEDSAVEAATDGQKTILGSLGSTGSDDGGPLSGDNPGLPVARTFALDAQTEDETDKNENVRVRIHRRCGVVDALAQKNDLDEYDDSKSAAFMGSSGPRASTGTTLYWPNGQEAGTLRDDLKITGQVRRRLVRADDRRLLCANPLLEDRAYAVEPNGILSVCIDVDDV